MKSTYKRFSVVALLIFGALLVLIPLLMRLSVAPYVFLSVDDVPRSQVAVILGASVYRGVPSPILANRTNAAIILYRAGKVKKILVTGDNAELNYDEVTPVRKYLIEAGIPADDVFLDHAGFDTYSSMYRAREIFHAQSIVIVTQDFHMSRALFIARHLGIQSYGLVADGESGITRDSLREIPASMKALIDLLTHRVPHYLGNPIPLEGPGTVTWY